MSRPRPPFLHTERTRHGARVWYVRRAHGAPRFRIRAEFGTPEFWTEYDAALRKAEAGERPAASGAARGTVEWLINQYRESAEWAALKPATRKQREAQYRVVIAGAGADPIAAMTPAAIRRARDARKDRPHAANNLLKALRGVFGWAVDAGLIAADPTKGIARLTGANDAVGFHVWTVDEVHRFESRWPVGTRQRLALDLALYTGLRRGDLARIGPPHRRGDTLAIGTEKSAGSIVVSVPVLDVLDASIAATPTGSTTYLVTPAGEPYTKESLGNWFRDQCRLAGVPGSFHGLRKAAATLAAERGATESQLNAIFGWKEGSGESATYIRTANRARLAAGAAHLLGRNGAGAAQET